jgi:TPR repeat protein
MGSMSALLDGPGEGAHDSSARTPQWFADLGNVDAQRAVGQILSAGGAGRDPEQALRYFQCDRQTPAFTAPSACQWFEPAVAVVHARRRSVMVQQMVRQIGSKLRCCRRAADGGDADAMAALGHMYANGRGVKASNGTALKW